ncbi:hypothetical protein COV17_03775 [Candidatus Woesearchaeota archaeon CG10_big_fil_rev_8_21_14_0_10_36_11]|nr:MAG: hypothetical protein COV17_03775 [Candidatus Woesearchaeota archaeon CG10_big_fil_rev_8_21_14_0_10_36_11]
MPTKKKVTRHNVYQLTKRLANPDVRLEDNSRYVVDNETLGILYAEFTVQSGKNFLPMSERTIPEERKYQRAFQHGLREFLNDRLQELVWRKKRAQDFKDEYSSKEFLSQGLPGDSLEHEVIELARMGNFAEIGRNLRLGAKLFHSRRRVYEFRLGSEYETIARCFKE